MSPDKVAQAEREFREEVDAALARRSPRMWQIAAMTLAIAALCAGGVYVALAIRAEQARSAQVEACERGNVLRRSLREFELSAAANRAQLAKLARTAAIRAQNERAARDYRELAARIPDVDCERVIDNPTAQLLTPLRAAAREP